MYALPARVRATSYITRTVAGQHELLIFDYPAKPGTGVHLPGGGIDPDERPDDAAVREAIEETGIAGNLALLGVVGIQQGLYDNGNPCVSLYFHIHTDDNRDRWTHTMIGDPDAWDTGQDVNCRFRPMAEAAELLRTSWHRQEEFVDLLFPVSYRNVLHRSYLTPPPAGARS